MQMANSLIRQIEKCPAREILKLQMVQRLDILKIMGQKAKKK